MALRPDQVLLTGGILRIPPLYNGQRRDIVPFGSRYSSRHTTLPDNTIEISVHNGDQKSVHVEIPGGNGYTTITVADFRQRQGRRPRTTVEENYDVKDRIVVSPLHPGPKHLRQDPTITIEYQDLP